jgi:hypothetical protein
MLHVLSPVGSLPSQQQRWKNNNQLAMRARDKEGKGGKAMAMGIRVAGDEEGKCKEEGNGVNNKGVHKAGWPTSSRHVRLKEHA